MYVPSSHCNENSLTCSTVHVECKFLGTSYMSRENLVLVIMIDLIQGKFLEEILRAKHIFLNFDNNNFTTESCMFKVL